MDLWNVIYSLFLISPNVFLALGDSVLFNESHHCVKSVQIRSYFWFVFSCIQSEYRKIRTRKNFVFGHFSRSGFFPCLNTSSWDRKRSTILNFSLYIIIKGMLHCLTFLRSGPPELPGKRFSESFRAYLNVSVHQFKAANEQGY